MARGQIQDRFWGKVNRQGPAECWPWIGAARPAGYGVFWARGRFLSAHLVAWQLARSLDPAPMPKGIEACHRCDNPRCVNPSHIFVGTKSDNMRDMISKGRHAAAKGRDFVPGHCIVCGHRRSDDIGRKVKRCRSCNNARNAARKIREHDAAPASFRDAVDALPVKG